jgi:hypothetical protein
MFKEQSSSVTTPLARKEGGVEILANDRVIFIVSQE